MPYADPRDVPTRPVRICVAVGLFGLGCALWWLGARDAPPLGVPARFAWVPFVTAAWLNLRWRSALRR
ncbi:hypothetical protein AB6N24_03825 [Cellulomonas sp. 179-A 4D5 NHS]|uniref:hypothetical protein n=1 Tax=Cellulomonas sp. 179-A 4D5 NHS TaxID=3142378 RepID=UPI0039A2ED3F